MTTLVAPAPGSALRWLAADSWTIAKRDLVHWVRNPTAIVFGVTFPVMFVLLFGYVFGSAISVPGGGDYREFLMPGMFAQAMISGAASTVAIVSTDRARGVTDRFRSMPVSRGAALVGRSIADLCNSALELTVLVVCGLLVGWVTRTGPLAVLAGIGVLFLMRFAMIWVGIFLGLIVSPEAAGMAWAPIFPLSMVANTFVSPEQMPAWLGTIAEWNPVSATAGAARILFGNAGAVTAGTASWPAQNALVLAVLWPLLIVAVFLPLAVRRYARAAR
ncbi:ABC-2 type transporter [Pseudonocardia thermophila]|uniref:Transport permease protein n=1 Tax=Pseudonocardia thermophila TaxID=1848 RepID=A0A1M6ZCW2_PSETH|nr:ABC transporter permease [Pseudonocardia thermophila]SHL28322.1 ABC-2 type transporter [Pseudonocardia thermophila]